MKDERRTKAELILELSELRHKMDKDTFLMSETVDDMAIGILLFDASSKVVLINAKMERYFGLRRGVVVGKDRRQFIDWLAVEDVVEQDTYLDKLREAYENDAPIERLECHILPGKGREERWLEHWIQPFETSTPAGGRIDCFYDISRGKRTELSLKEHQDLLQKIVSSTKDAMIAINQSGLITIFNPAAERMFGRSKEEMLGEPLDPLMPEKYRKRHHVYVRKYFETGVPDNAIGKTVELPGKRSDGSEFPMEISLSPGWIESGAFVVAVARDITERKRAEEELKQKTEELEAERGRLKEKNIALNQVLDHIEKQKQSYKEQICRDVEEVVAPVLKDLKGKVGSGHAKKLEILEGGIKIILERDQDDIKERFSSLTPRELEICRNIRTGLSSKQISMEMNISVGTVHKHREKIRKKLGITNKGVNLGSILQLKRLSGNMH